MDERLLAESVRSALEQNNSRILVKSIHNPERFAGILGSVLDEMRLLVVDCTDDSSLKKSFSLYFAGDVFPGTETAFEAGWRSHATEISLYSETSGLEVVAGLHSIKAEVKDFIVSGSVPSLKKQSVVKILASFAWSLPTVICFVNYSEGEDNPVSMLLGSSASPVPAVIVIGKDSGDLNGADAIIESGMMSPESIMKCFNGELEASSLEEVMLATGGDDGLVKLYSGLYALSGKVSSRLFSALGEFLDENPELAVFAKFAALFGMQFLPEEVFKLSGIANRSVFTTGRRINLWNGHLVGYFSSASTREYILHTISGTEKDRFLEKAATAVLDVRGRNSRSWQAAGDLYVRSGNRLSACEAYGKAAETGRGDRRKADMYRRAAHFSDEDAEQFLFLSALNLYRGELLPEALDVVKSIGNQYGNAVSVLRNLCTDSGDIDGDAGCPGIGETGFPELSREIVESRSLRKNGSYHKAERILLNCRGVPPLRSAVFLAELSEQLYKRGIVAGSLNVMMLARREAESLGAEWLERKALFASMKAWNRLGKHNRLRAKLGRLTELVLLSGNRRKLVSVYNLYANSLIYQQNLTEALDIYTASLRSLAAVPDSQKMRIVILNNIGVTQQMLYRASESLRTLMRQVRISVSSGNLSQACIAYGNMARIFINLCKTDAAEDCLETMIELAALGKIAEASEPVCSISSQLAFMKEDTETALSLIDQSIKLSIKGGKRRRHSYGLVMKGNMLLRTGRYEEASKVFAKSVDVSRAAGSEINQFLSEMKFTVAECFLGRSHPAELLSVKYRGDPEDTQKGEQMYYHWLLTGSRQSLTASAQLLSRGLSHGLYLHSYLFMLQQIKRHFPVSLADAIPLVHNYPSCH
jgi:tetratricopeptide (TPR) repeat protein